MAEPIGIGLIVSLVLSEAVGLSAGGLITPAYLALLADQPWRLAGTLIAAALALGLYRAIAAFLILFGRRRFVAMVLLGILCKWAVAALAPGLAATLGVPVGAMGFVLPGLIANDFERQGVLATLAMLALTTAACVLALRALGY
ncbi:MAG: poly-gamma-glutamate biosynthesis protein PgsC [Armatimonadota bacterium]|nr:poly-gamma-glutamate biosynthesis protein PgsC [Armatimonadota bacterium]